MKAIQGFKLNRRRLEGTASTTYQESLAGGKFGELTLFKHLHSKRKLGELIDQQIGYQL